MSDASASFTNGLYTIDPITVTVTDGSVTLGAKLATNENLWCIFDNFQLTCTSYDGYNYAFSDIASGVDYTTQGATPEGGHTYVLYNETGKFLYNDGGTPKVSTTQAEYYTLETTDTKFYIRSQAGLMAKTSNNTWFTTTSGSYGDDAKWTVTLISDNKYTLQNYRNSGNAYFAPNSQNEETCYRNKTSLTGWYFIDVTNKDLALSLLYTLQQTKANTYDTFSDSDAKDALGVALDRVYLDCVCASNFTSSTYDVGAAAIQAAVDAYYAARFASLTGSEGGEDITSWITNPTPTSNGDGWTVSVTPSYNSGSNVAEYWKKNGASISQTINLPSGYYRLTALAFTRTNMSASLAATGATSGELNSMNIVTVSSNTVNNLTGANTWFNNGYGVNELDFYVPTKQEVTISLTADNTKDDYWMVWRSFQLTAVGNEEVNLLNLEKYLDNAALTRANELLNDASYVRVTGSERTNLATAVTNLTNYADGESTVAANVNARKTLKYALVAPYNAMSPINVKYAYDEYYYENETATRLEADVTSVTAPTTAAEATTAAHAINVINYNYLEEKGYEDVSSTVLGTWTDNNVGSRTSQHYDGTTTSTYFEQSVGWGSATVWEMSRQQTINLSAGAYVLKVAARASTGADAELSVTVGNNTPIVTYAGHHGDSGLGITTGGEACYVSHDTDENKVYANNNTGRGFEWRYIPFTLTADGEVTLKFYAVNTTGAQSQFVSFTSLGIWTDPAVAAKTDLLTAINNASASRTNEGTGIFQIPASAGTTLAEAISVAQGVYDNEDATKDDVTGATSTLNTAVTTYKNAELNAPASDKRYKLTLANKGALTFKTASTEGGYGMPFQTAADYKAQAFMLTAVEGETNTYTLSFEDLDGNTRYVCTRTQYGEGGTGAAGIRTFANDNEKEALKIKIQPAETANVFYMLNTENSDAKLGATNDGDFYTDATNSDWSIAEASQAEVIVNVANGKFATRIFPFAPGDIDGITFYSCAGTAYDRATLTEVTEPAANVPYILKASKDVNETVSGWGVAASTSYTEGYLTGVYTAETIAASVAATETEDGANRYVLQTQGDVQAFYKVDAAFNATANRCYLTVPVAKTGSGVKAFYLDIDGSATAISEIENGKSSEGKWYNLAGQRVNKAQKGIYIVNGKKVAVK